MHTLGLFLAACALVCAASAETIRGGTEPIPSDKCGANVITSEDDRLFVFALSEDSVLWYKFQKVEGGWSTWRPLANRQKMSSGPRPVRHINGTLQVFARGVDRRFYVTTLTSLNEWTNWESPFQNKTFLSPPTAVITTTGSCRVFGISLETRTVWYCESSPITSANFVWSNWAHLGGDATSPPSALIDAESLNHIFIRGLNRALWHLSETYSESTGRQWGNWECLGGVLASSPKVPVTLNGVNLVEAYTRAADKALWHRAQTANATSVLWGAWESLNGILASGPSVAVDDDGMADVFVRATDKSIYFKSQYEDSNGGHHFSDWMTLGGMFSTTPSVVVRADGMIDLFARGVDKAIWHAHQVEANGTRTFSSWNSLGGHTRKFTC